MSDMNVEHGEPVFSPEKYKDCLVDIIHRTSLQRVIDGKKGDEITTMREAAVIQRRIQQLQDAGVDIRFIDDSLDFEAPEGQWKHHVVGGAFDKQCIADYMKSAEDGGYEELQQDPHLTLRLD